MRIVETEYNNNDNNIMTIRTVSIRRIIIFLLRVLIIRVTILLLSYYIVTADNGYLLGTVNLNFGCAGVAERWRRGGPSGRPPADPAVLLGRGNSMGKYIRETGFSPRSESARPGNTVRALLSHAAPLPPSTPPPTRIPRPR